MDRRIAHLDMDAFYASVELLRHPQLEGLPVVIGGRRRRSTEAPDKAGFTRLRDYVGRGVATTATYPARALGVHSAMGLMKAAKLAPDAILLPADFEEYGCYSRRFKAAVAQIAPRIEDRGIDEIYIDLTDVPGETVELAGRIQESVRRATGLSCSIGIAPNKLLAKLASELHKPGGITVITQADLASRIWPLPARRIHGVGPRAEARLAALGIRTVGELARAPIDLLAVHFGKRSAAWLANAAHGRDERPVVTEQAPKSISRETTFERDLDPRRDREALSQVLAAFCERLSGDLKRKGYAARTIGIKLRYADFRTVTRDLTLERATDAEEAIRSAARACLKRVPLDRRLRLFGIRAGSFVPAEQAALDETPERAGGKSGESLSLFD